MMRTINLLEPLVDILLASYNGECYIAEQIESIQQQTYTNWRLLISDDCSTDGTLDIVRRFASMDSRIEIVSANCKYGGAKENFFAAMGYSDSSYCMFCDQDDVWLPNKVEITLEAMMQLEAKAPLVPTLVFTDMKVVSTNLDIIDDSFERFSAIDPTRTGFRQVLAQSIGAGCTMMINSMVRELALRIENTDDVIMHDWWLCLIASAFGQIGYLDVPTSLYRQHSNNEVGALKYSPLNKALHLDQMKNSVVDTIRQAGAVRSYFEDILDNEQLHIIGEFISISETKGLPAVIHLIRSGCWKRGLRKIGQIIVCFEGIS